MTKKTQTITFRYGTKSVKLQIPAGVTKHNIGFSQATKLEKAFFGTTRNIGKTPTVHGWTYTRNGKIRTIEAKPVKQAKTDAEPMVSHLDGISVRESKELVPDLRRRAVATMKETVAQEQTKFECAKELRDDVSDAHPIPQFPMKSQPEPDYEIVETSRYIGDKLVSRETVERFF
jgi:hypothetical protein